MNCTYCTYGRLYETVLNMSCVVVSFVSLKYFKIDHALIMKVYSCVREFDSSYINAKNSSHINVKVYASLIRHIVACSFRLKDYCFSTWIKERVRFICSVFLSAHGLLFGYMD